ncbi:MAG: hypothetical protein IT223_04335, partial [Crocinitomicaceae bacterium]|nr:hypothetical protein [Crocinitomicaceae bacterium]
MKYILFFIFFSLAHCVIAQFSTGTWRDHLPYGQTIDVCVTEQGYIYCATPYSMFFYNPFESDLQRISKINRLSDVGISSIEYDQNHRSVIVGYQNGNLDILFDGYQINIPDIKISSLIGDKRIYDILPYGDKVYLSTGIGIVVLDLEKMEIKSTYIIGSGGSQVKVNDVAIFDNRIYAATDNGIKVADLSNSFLSNYQNWSDYAGLPSMGAVKEIEFFVDYLFINIAGETQDIIYKRPVSGGNWEVFAQYDGMFYNNMWCGGGWLTLAGSGSYMIFHNDLFMNVNETTHQGVVVNCNNAVVDLYGGVWAADDKGGLLWRKNDGAKLIVRPQGPAEAAVRRLSAYNKNFWIAHGGVNDSWGNTWHKAPLSGFVNEQWVTINPGNGINDTEGINDMMTVAIDPNNNSRVSFGSWDEGLVEKQSDGSIRIYNSQTGDNTLEEAGYDWAPGWTGVAGLAYDLYGNLWIGNSYAEHHLHVRSGNNFYAFGFSPLLNETDKIGDMYATQFNQIWAVVPGKGILVLDHNGTIGIQSDDNFKLLTDEDGEGGLPSKDVFCIQEDLDGEV